MHLIHNYYFNYFSIVPSTTLLITFIAGDVISIVSLKFRKSPIKLKELLWKNYWKFDSFPALEMTSPAWRALALTSQWFAHGKHSVTWSSATWQNTELSRNFLVSSALLFSLLQVICPLSTLPPLPCSYSTCCVRPIGWKNAQTKSHKAELERSTIWKPWIIWFICASLGWISNSLPIRWTWHVHLWDPISSLLLFTSHSPAPLWSYLFLMHRCIWDIYFYEPNVSFLHCQCELRLNSAVIKCFVSWIMAK